MSPVRGVRPVAKRISSASRRSPVSVTATTVPFSRVTDSTETPVRRSTPASVSASAISSPANGSIRASRPPSPRTSIVTREPRACQAVAISTATTPPPTTIRRPGAVLALVASRLVQGPTSASPGSGGRAAALPVQTATACRAVRVRRLPSVPVTSTVRAPVSRPCPRCRSTPMPSTHWTWPSSFQCEVNSSRRARTACASRGSWTFWARPGRRRASARAMTGRSRALLGMHAQ